MKKQTTHAGGNTGVTIVLADDHAVVRQGLKSLLESDPELIVVGEAADGFEAIDLVKRHKPTVLIADLMMPQKTGLDAARALRRMKSKTQVIILSVYGDRGYLLEAFKTGAAAYLVKESCGVELFQAIRVVLSGGRYLSPTVSESFIGTFAIAGGMPENGRPRKSAS